MFLGAPVWPFKWHPPYDDAIRRVARLGFRGVELVAWTSDALAEYYTPDRVRELRRLIDGEGLILTNLWHAEPDLGSPDPARRARAVDGFQRAVEVTAALGAPLLVGTTPYPFAINVPRMLTRPTSQEWIVEVPRGLDWARNYSEFVAAFGTCCATAERAGVRVACEPHPYRWVTTAQSMLRLIEHTGARNLGFNLDPSHLFPVGEIPHYVVYQLGERIYHAHFSDNDGQTNAHWRPGKGKVDWAALLRALADVGYDGVISIELEDVPGCARSDGPAEAGPALERELRLAAAYLRALADEEGVPLQGLSR